MTGVFMESSSPLWLAVMCLSAVSMLFFFKMVDSRAGRSLALLLMVGSFGWRSLMHKPAVRPYKNNVMLTAAEQTIDNNGRITVRSAGHQTPLFQHFQTSGAAQLRAVQPLNSSEWIAVFSTTALGGKAPALENNYKGWFERAEGESNETLPLITNQKALGGDIRVEDATSGETLFAYQADGEFRPVAIVKQKDRIKGITWQVVFSNQAGLLSQKKID
jgi:hypothetical protein